MSLLRQVADQFFGLIRSWYAVDRIRVSPSAGRLLSLSSGQTVLICGKPANIRSRTIRMCNHEACLVYGLEYIGSNCTLTVSVPHSACRISGQIAFTDYIVPVFDDDIVVLASERPGQDDSVGLDIRVPDGTSRV